MKHPHSRVATRRPLPPVLRSVRLATTVLMLATAMAVLAPTLALGNDTGREAGATDGNPEQFGLTQDELMLMDDVGSLPASGEDNGRQYAIIQGYAIAEGDMVLGRVRADGSLLPRLQRRGLGTDRLLDRWPDGIIPYQFAAGLSNISRDNTLAAIAHWNDNTRILLVERTDANTEEYPDFLSFEAGSGCASYVGRYGLEQPIWVADNCAVGNIVHEIGHAIGLFHEHTRPDRDTFIEVNWDNIQSDKTFNFDVLQAGVEAVGDYDYGSIMHYGDYYFTANGQPTISAFADVGIGQRDALSAGDIASIDSLYATDLAVSASTREDGDNWQVDIVVNNIGELGANTLSLDATAGNGAQWLTITPESGWDCLIFGSTLRCERETLPEQQESRFSVALALDDPGNAELQLALDSRTLDTTTENNSASSTFTVNTTTQDPAPPIDAADSGDSSDDTDTQTADSTGSEPDIGAAEASASGGGIGIAMLPILIVLSRWRRRRHA